MDFSTSPLYAEIQDAITNCDGASQVAYRAIIHLDDQGHTVTPQAVGNFTTTADFVNNFADEQGIELVVTLGEYAKLIYPNRTRLQITLTKSTLFENSSGSNKNEPEQSERYTAILKEDRSAPTQMQGFEVRSKEDLDLGGVITLQFQIFSKAVERLRVMQCGTIHRRNSVEAIMRAEITRAFQRVEVDASKRLLGVTVFPAANNKVYEQVIVDQATMVVDLPGFLHRNYGVYNAGLGTYIRGRQWHVYPLYDTSITHQQAKSLTIYIVPKRLFPEMERTYRVKDDSISIISSSDTDFRGDNDINYVDTGNGMRFTDADALFNNFVDVKDNRAVTRRKATVNELAAVKQSTGVNYAPVNNRPITANHQVQYSELAAKKGGYLQLFWQNSDPQLLIPGQAVRIMYFDKDRVQQAHGILHKVVSMAAKVGGYQTPKHVHATKLTIFTTLRRGDQS